MRLQIKRHNPKEAEKTILPSSKNFLLPGCKSFRMQDLLLLKVSIVCVILLIIYVCPYKLVQPIQEKQGILQHVEEAKNSGRRGRIGNVHGLYLQLDDQIYYLDGEYISRDTSDFTFDFEKIRIATKETRSMERLLKNELPLAMTIDYITYAHIGNKTDFEIVGLYVYGDTWINTELSMKTFRLNVFRYTILWSFVLVILIVIYFIRKYFDITVS